MCQPSAATLESAEFELFPTVPRSLIRRLVRLLWTTPSDVVAQNVPEDAVPHLSTVGAWVARQKHPQTTLGVPPPAATTTEPHSDDHDESTTSTPTKPYQCQICGAGYEQLQGLQLHMERHCYASYVYRCPHEGCDRVFRSKKPALKHRGHSRSGRQVETVAVSYARKAIACCGCGTCFAATSQESAWEKYWRHLGGTCKGHGNPDRQIRSLLLGDALATVVQELGKEGWSRTRIQTLSWPQDTHFRNILHLEYGPRVTKESEVNWGIPVQELKRWVKDVLLQGHPQPTCQPSPAFDQPEQSSVSSAHARVQLSPGPAQLDSPMAGPSNWQTAKDSRTGVPRDERQDTTHHFSIPESYPGPYLGSTIEDAVPASHDRFQSVNNDDIFMAEDKLTLSALLGETNYRNGPMISADNAEIHGGHAFASPTPQTSDPCDEFVSYSPDTDDVS